MTTEFYSPTPAEQAKIFVVKKTLSLISGAIGARVENHGTFADMVYWCSNEERWQWIELLKPIAEFYDRLNHTSVNPETGENKVKAQAAKSKSAILEAM